MYIDLFNIFWKKNKKEPKNIKQNKHVKLWQPNFLATGII